MSPLRPLKSPPDPSRLQTLLLGPRLLSYTLKRSSRRTIGFVISRSGLTITAPMRLSMRAIEAAIADKQRWIFAKLTEWVDLAPTALPAPPIWQDGSLLSYRGGTLTLHFQADSDTSRRSRQRITHDGAAGTLTVALPAATAALPDEQRNERIAALLRAWLQGEAKRCFAERLALYAPVVGVHFAAFALSSARTRWGSCSSTGHIRLNWRLIHFTPDILDYVVVHELAHLREMNHSPRFWAVVAGVMPDYQTARNTLKHPAPGLLPAL